MEASQLPGAVKGGCESALEFGGGVVVGFCFGGAQGASQLPGCEGGMM